MSNKRVYQLKSRESYSQASGDYILVDGSLLPSAMKLGLSAFASKEFVEESINDLSNSAIDIQSKIQEYVDGIPYIGTDSNVNVVVEYDEDNKVYNISTSSYNLASDDDETLQIVKDVDGYEVKFNLSANTYTQSYIDEKLESINSGLDLSGLGNVAVRNIAGTNKYQIYLDGITAVNEGEEINVSGNSVVINEYNEAYDYSLSQGNGNYAKEHTLTQGSNNSGYEYSLSQGYNNLASGNSLSQGSHNIAIDTSLAQGVSNVAKNVSLAHGINNYAENGSLAIGNNVSAYDSSFAFGYGSYTEANDNSIAFGDKSYASGDSFSFFGGSAFDNSFSVGKNSLVSSHTTALGDFNEPRFISGDNPYTFALGDGTMEEPHTFFRVDQNSVYYSPEVGVEIDLVENIEKVTVVCDTIEEYKQLKDQPGYEHKTFIVG